jgi:hypothetical protein
MVEGNLLMNTPGSSLQREAFANVHGRGGKFQGDSYTRKEKEYVNKMGGAGGVVSSSIHSSITVLV